jgi:hypothetical protein
VSEYKQANEIVVGDVIEEPAFGVQYDEYPHGKVSFVATEGGVVRLTYKAGYRGRMYLARHKQLLLDADQRVYLYSGPEEEEW